LLQLPEYSTTTKTTTVGTGNILPPLQPPAPETLMRPRRGSFIVVGDWGHDSTFHGNLHNSSCQKAVADAMLAKMRELGDVKFMINVGDSFYPGGVVSKTDPQWENKWRRVYHQELRSVPWYSVYGNHDLYYDACACSPDPLYCAQVNADPNNLDFFYMPNRSWFKPHPELDVEVVALDLNTLMVGWNPELRAWSFPWWCRQHHCHQKCWGNLRKHADYAVDLLQARVSQSSMKNLIVFSHYPTDYLVNGGRGPELLNMMRGATQQHIEYFGGHRHSVDQTTTASIAPHGNWLTGGGGGWGADTPMQGFVVGEVNQDSTVRTYEVLVDSSFCSR